MDRRSQITHIVRKVSGKDVMPQVDESLFDSGTIDSFGLQDLTAELEKTFSIRIPDEDLSPRKFDSIERIEQYIEEHGN